MKRLSLALAAAAGVLALSAPATARQAPGAMEPGRSEAPRVWVNSTVLTGTVTGIDRANRLLMVRDQQGSEQVVLAGPQLSGFERLRVGEEVALRYSQAEALALAERTDIRQDPAAMRAQVRSAAMQLAGRARRSAGQPDVQPVTVMATVQGVDRSSGSLTLRGDGGMPLDVLAAPQALRHVDRNDQIVIGLRPPTALEIAPQARGMSAAVAASPRAASLEGQDATRMAPGSYEAPRVWVNTEVMRGTVTGLDPENELLMVRDTQGQHMILRADPTVPNFEELEPGREVTMRYTQGEALALARRTDARQDPALLRPQVAAAAQQLAGRIDHPDQQPVAEPVTMLVRVDGIDRSDGKLTLRDEAGMRLDVLAGPQALRHVGMGDEVMISFRPPTAVEFAPEGDGMSAATAGSSLAGGRDAGR